MLRFNLSNGVLHQTINPFHSRLSRSTHPRHHGLNANSGETSQLAELHAQQSGNDVSIRPH
ncbi:hypothetical protein J1N35_046030 [Gossypium stocksii]|uniref:Uncharacterized protein n=1 Tax=Gossypium stocksii TaxID=47602 RepID=A0A9D3U5K7_9ROSI|nr:hypothetical protein J1N35_046030 [Gossypium stocksii]